MDTFQPGEITFARWKFGGDSFQDLRNTIAAEVKCLGENPADTATTGLARAATLISGPDQADSVAVFNAALRAREAMINTLAPKQLS